MHNLHKRNEPNQIPSSSLLNPASIDTLQSRPASAASSVFDTTPKGVHVVTNQSTDDTPHGRVGESNDRDGSNSSFIVVSGGTGCNSICSAFGEAVCYVLPVSDNGGSSSEIIRVLGGPSIGDIRSRLIRLIPTSSPTSASERIRHLLAYRFPLSEVEARDQWRGIVEGRSSLWSGIPSDRKETIRGFLVHFENELLRRAHRSFSFRNGSVGNYFIAAAHLFFRSVPSAIFLFSSITGSQAHIIPVLVTNHTVTIAAELEDSSTIVGQCEISHPVPKTSSDEVQATEYDPTGPWSPTAEDGIVRPSIANVAFTKSEETSEQEGLPSRIKRIYYINQYGQEIFPLPNPDYLANLNSKTILVYSCGSLYTSIIPCLALRGVGKAIASSSSLRAKVLLLNAQNDRETPDYTAFDYLNAIGNALNASYIGNTTANLSISTFVTHLVILRASNVVVDKNKIEALGVRCIFVCAMTPESQLFTATVVREALDLVTKDVGK